MADIIIKGGRVLTTDGTFTDSGVVVVDNGVITFVGKDTREKSDNIIDARGCAVMPGLINAHTHLSMTLFRGYADGLAYQDWINRIQAAEMKLTPAYVKAGASLGVLEMIRSGTTTFADMYIHMDEVAKIVEKTGMRAALGYGMIEGMNEDSETKLKIREKFTKKWNGEADGRISTMYAPHSPESCSKEFLLKVREMAVRDNTAIHIHMLETDDELNRMKKRYGMCSINFLNHIGFLDPNVLAAHCIWISEDDIDILKNKNVNVVHCPSSNMALGTGIAPVPKMFERGVNVALGTDSAASGSNLDMWKEMRMASLIHNLKDLQVITPDKVLKMSTVNGAKALGINAGMLKAGYSADIIIVDIKKPQFTSSNLISALVHGASGCDVRTTMVGGKLLMEDHKLMTLDEDRVIENANIAISNIMENS